MAIDKLDRRILRYIQKDSAISAECLAEKCGTSPSTALRRLEKMRRDKVILGEVAIVDGESIGRPLKMVISARLEGEDRSEVARFTKRIEENPDVMQFYFVTGTTDYFIILSARTMADYDEFVETNLIADPYVSLTRTNVVIRPIKISLEVPVDEPNSA